MPELKIRFNSHGLGDCVNFAHVLQLYKRRGYDVNVQGEENKLFLWQVAGVKLIDYAVHHPWGHPWQFDDLNQPDCLGNKVAHNLHCPEVMPEIGDRETLWPELCGVRLSAHDLIPAKAHAEVDRFLQGLPRPIICLHSRGTNWQERKALPIETDFRLTLELLERLPGSVIILDFDRRAPMVGDARCKGIKPAWGHISLDRLCALYEHADLLIGVDSGPFHLAALTTIPALGVFRQVQPVRVCLPNSNATYLVSGLLHDQWERRRNLWSFAEYAGAEPQACEIAEVAVNLLSRNSLHAPRHESILPEERRELVGSYHYSRCGYDARKMELCSDGTIGLGAAGCETHWFARRVDGEIVITILGNRVTCHLRRDADGVWRGRWLFAEKMPIELTPEPRDVHGPPLTVRVGTSQQVKTTRPERDITLVYIDGDDPDVGVTVLNHCSAMFPVAAVKLLTYCEPSRPLNGECVLIPKLDYQGWSRFTVSELAKHVDTSHCLIVHPDGFILNPDKWSDEFLDFDYVGAPWSEPFRNRVGNGGFSLRSRRLLDWGIGHTCQGPEDVFICRANYEQLISCGIRFAPIEVASRFSMEHSLPDFPRLPMDESFGFHGLLTDLRKRLFIRLQSEN